MFIEFTQIYTEYEMHTCMSCNNHGLKLLLPLQKSETRQRYKRVWMVDVRDTFFQADPFVMLSPDTSAFYAFKGVESKTIASCGWNGGWVSKIIHTYLHTVRISYNMCDKLDLNMKYKVRFSYLVLYALTIMTPVLKYTVACLYMLQLLFNR